MTMLGRRKHSRFLLAQPVEGHLRVREEVAVEELTDREAVVLSPEPYWTDERLTLEIPGDLRRRVNVKVSECRPAVIGDGPIRHRCRLVIEDDEAAPVRSRKDLP
jgi:hypothetical protein